MQLIPLEIKTPHFTYQQREREENIAIYAQILDNKSIRYEVIVIQVQPPGTFFGKAYPEREIYPSPRTWGTYGFTFMTYDAAKKKFHELLQRNKTQRENSNVASGE